MGINHNPHLGPVSVKKINDYELETPFTVTHPSFINYIAISTPNPFSSESQIGSIHSYRHQGEIRDFLDRTSPDARDRVWIHYRGINKSRAKESIRKFDQLEDLLNPRAS